MDEVKERRVSIQMRFEWTVALLFGLSVFDASATDFGLRFGIIEEVNPWMNYIYLKSIFAFYFIKIVLPISLLAIHSFSARSRIVQHLLFLSITLYGVIACMHLFWLVVHFR